MDLDDGIADIICYKKDPTKADLNIALPESNRPDQNPLNYAHICAQQQQDDKLLDK